MQIKATRGHFSPSDRQNTKIADVPGIATGSWQGGGGGEGSPLADHGGGGRLLQIKYSYIFDSQQS